MNHRQILLGASFFILTSCVVSPRRGGGLEVVPILPVVVELDADQPYYEQDGYHYHYADDRWQYSTSRNGPWMELPRSHWPKETRWRGRDRNRDRDQDRDRRH
jgi:hypothetical protein